MKLIITNLPILIIIFINLFFLSSCQEVKFKFHLKRIDEYCLTEYFPDKTLIIFKVNSDSHRIKCEVTYDDKPIMTKVTNEFIYPFTTNEGGDYSMCVTNLDTKDEDINFSLEYGVGAKDYSSIARAKDLKPVDLALEKLSDRAKQLSRFISYNQGHEKIFENILDEISSKLMIYSSIVICIMIIVGYIETLYLQNFMRRRKII